MKRFISVLLLAAVILLPACSDEPADNDNPSSDVIHTSEYRKPLSEGPIGREAVIQYVNQTGDAANYTVTVRRQTGTTITDAEFKNNGDGLYMKHITVFDNGTKGKLTVLSERTQYFDKTSGRMYGSAKGEFKESECAVADFSLRTAIGEALGESFFDTLLSALTAYSFDKKHGTYVLPEFHYPQGSEMMMFEDAAITLDANYHLAAFMCTNGPQTTKIEITHLNSTSLSLPN